ncbi:MAG: PD40 domain-containing protein [Planctomycetia bacterium]|nr:PD40 domain-containing protein [Planctomycetia bacterium]
MLATVLLFGPHAAPAAAGGGKPAPKPVAPGAAQPVGGLPAGCVRLVDGRHPTLSPDGQRLAFGRMTFDARQVDETGAPVPIPELWVRDLVAKKEWKLPVPSSPDAFTSDGVLLVRAGYGVDPAKGERVPAVAAVPATVGFQRPAWTRDGRRVLIVPRATPEEPTALALLDAAGSSVPLAGTVGLRTDQAVVVAWSPDAKRVYVNALFAPEGRAPVRRVGLVDVASGEMRVLAEMPEWIDIPGHYGTDSVITVPGYGFGPYRPGFEADGRVRRNEWKRPTGPRYGPDVWDAAGRRVTWIEGQGRKEADAFVAEVESGAVYRVTVDGETKWSPALDPTGRRLAFLTADLTAYDNLVTRRRIRVLELATGVAKDLPVAGTDGVPGTLGWTPDGRQLVYELRGGTIGGIYAQAVPPAADRPADARPATPELRPKERTVAWLASADADRVAAAIVRADEAWDASFVGPVRAALVRWMKSDHFVVHGGLRLLGSKGVKEAVPEFVLALGTDRGSTQRLAVQWLARLGAKQVVPELDRLRSGTTFELRVAAAGAMVELGDARGWDTLRTAAKEDAVAARLDVCAALWRIRDPVAVDLLIPWVGDARRHDGWSSPGRDTLGAAAQLALAALTGASHGGDPAAWKAWWNDTAKRTLPAEPPPVPDEARVLFDE